jgi:hypothetical protein
MYTPKPINISIWTNRIPDREKSHTEYVISMEYNGEHTILKTYSKSKKRAMEYLRKLRTGSYKCKEVNQES